MLDKKICIVNSKILFELLFELINDLPFKVNFKYYVDLKSDDFSSKDIIYLLEKKEKKLINKFNIEQVFIVDNLPIKIENLVSQINIKFLKSNFHRQANIKIKDYYLDLNSKFIKKNSKILKLTEKEIQIIMFLFSSQKAKTVQDLQKNIWNHHEILETHTVETHIYRLRKKIKDEFDDEKFILNSVSGYNLKI